MTNETVGKCHFTFKVGPSVVEPVVECKMRCNDCGVKIQFEAVSRRAGQDLMEWMEKVQQVAGQVHRHVSPACTGATCDLQFPVPEGTKALGEAVKS